MQLDNSLCIPGQDVSSKIMNILSENFLFTDSSLEIKLGPGLQVQDENSSQESIVPPIKATRFGTLCNLRAKRFWLHSHTGYYEPCVGDFVVGKVVMKTAEFFKIDICAVNTAMLLAMAFDRATRKNRPNLDIDSWVFARVSHFDPHIDPELDCLTVSSKDLKVQGEGLGEIEAGEGYALAVGKLAPSFAQQLQLSIHPLLNSLGERFVFESTVGANGYFAIRAGSETLAHAIVEYICRFGPKCRSLEDIQKLLIEPISGILSEQDSKYQ